LGTGFGLPSSVKPRGSAKRNQREDMFKASLGPHRSPKKKKLRICTECKKPVIFRRQRLRVHGITHGNPIPLGGIKESTEAAEIRAENSPFHTKNEVQKLGIYKRTRKKRRGKFGPADG